MGAWHSGVFGNDDAADWAVDFDEATEADRDEVIKLFETHRETIYNPSRNRSDPGRNFIREIAEKTRLRAHISDPRMALSTRAGRFHIYNGCN